MALVDVLIPTFERKTGGCGILPGGTYHLDLPTTVEDRRVNANELFDEIAREYHIYPIESIP